MDSSDNLSMGSVGQPQGSAGHPVPNNAVPGNNPNLVQPPAPQNQTFAQSDNPNLQTTQASAMSPVDRAVGAATTIIARTQNNPFEQARELAALKSNYLEEQYGIKPQG